MRLLRTQELVDRIGVSRQCIWGWEREGLFPQRVRIGANKVGWIEAEVDEWIAARPRVGGGGGAVAVESDDADDEG